MRIDRLFFLSFFLLFLASCNNPQTTEPKATDSPPPPPLPIIEGLNEIKEMNIRQQAVYIEQSKFIPTVKEVAIGVEENTDNYKYKVIPQGNNQGVMQIAESKKADQNSYIGIIFAVKDPSNAPTSIAQICETNKPLTADLKIDKIPQSAAETINCPTGTTIVPPNKYLPY